MITMKEQERMIDEKVALFPERFGLRNFPDQVFMISKTASYVLDDGTDVMLYTYVLCDDGEWKSFAKGLHGDLMNQIVELSPHGKIASSR